MNSNPVKTALTISVGFLVVFILTGYKWALWTALIVGLCGVFSTVLSKWIEIIWMKLALILSYIVPNIVMGIIFFCLLLPISLLSRLFRKGDALQLKNNSITVYKEKPGAYDKSHFENMW